MSGRRQTRSSGHHEDREQSPPAQREPNFQAQIQEVQAQVQEMRTLMIQFMQNARQPHAPQPAAEEHLRQERQVSPPPPMPRRPRGDDVHEEEEDDERVFDPDYLRMIQELRNMHTPHFHGTLETAVAEDWLSHLTQDLRFVHCPSCYRAEVATHYLYGDASHWWKEVVAQYPRGHKFTWVEFREEFMRRWIRIEDLNQRVSDFINLKQGDRSIGEYERDFRRLMVYAMNLVPTEENKINQFIVGLNDRMQRKVDVLEKSTLTELTSRLKRIETHQHKKRAREQEMMQPRQPIRLPVRIHYRPQDKGKAPASRAKPQPRVVAPRVRPQGPVIRETCKDCDWPHTAQGDRSMLHLS